MTAIVQLSWEFRSFFFQRLNARKLDNFALVIVVLVFVLNKIIKIEIFYLSANMNAGLLRDLTLGVSRDNIHSCSFNHFARGLSFRGRVFEV